MEEKNSNVWKLIVGVSVVLALIGVMLFVYFTFFRSNPVSVFRTAINNAYFKLDSNLENIDDSNNFNVPTEPVRMYSNFSINSNLDDFKEYDGLSYSVDMVVDYQNEKSFLELSASKFDESIIKVLISYLEGNSYFKSDELFNKVLLLGQTDSFGFDFSQQLNGKEIDYDELRFVLKSLKDLLIDSLDKDYFEVTDERIVLKDVKYNVEKYTYVLDDYNFNRTINFILKGILDNSDLLESISNLYNVDVDEVESLLNSYFENYEESEGLSDTVFVSLYVKNKEVLMSELNVGDVLLSYSNVDDLFEFSIVSSDAEFKVYENTDNVEFYLSNNGLDIISGYVVSKDDKFEVNVSIDSQGVPINLFFILDNINIQDNERTFDFSLGMNMNVFGEKYNVSLDGQFTTVNGVDVPSFDVSNAIDVNALSEQDLENIMFKLNDVLSKLGFGDFATQSIS